VFGSTGPVQRSFDDLGVPLAEAVFCVVDLETTGGDPGRCGITEVGALKVRGGEVLGTYQTLVNPGMAIPPSITVLTGLTDAMVAPAPTVQQVLPSLLEFIGGAVIVGHNVRFDLAFLQAALRRWGGPLLGNQHLDTLALARRLLTHEVPDHRLGTLAERLGLAHRPCHRALDDARATCDLLHALIERATAWGVTGLDDLVALPTVAGHPQWRKLRLTAGLPRRPGVYQFLDRHGRVLYVGKASDLRARVRSYFSSETRRRVPQLLGEVDRIEHRECTSSLEAEVLELRLIHQLQPPYNRQGRRPRRPVWVRLTDEAFPRLSIVRSATGPGLHLGPLPSRREAERVIEAVHSAVPLRRCTRRMGRRGPAVDAPCGPAQLGVAACPCSGLTDAGSYARIVEVVRRAFTGEAHLLLDPLEQRMRSLAAAERFEEAADTRDRAGALVRALGRDRRVRRLAGLDRLVLELPGGEVLELGPGGALGGAAPATLDEALCVARWLDRNADRVRLVAAEGDWCSPLPALPSFTPRDPPRRRILAR
jgi:DNA polymerase-3 subunit epsilon